MGSAEFELKTVRLYVSVFLLSTAALAFEILLLRVFAIEEFVHFAYMAITIALLGFGAGGTLVTLLRRRLRGREAAAYRALAAAGSLGLLLAPWAAGWIPFEPTRLVWESQQWLYLAGLYVVLALPFLFLASAIALAFVWRPKAVAGLYAANLLGSGAGAGLALGAMALLAPEMLPLAPLAVAGLGTVWVWAPPPLRAGRGLVAGLLVALVALMGIWPPWRLSITEYKGLPQTLAFPGAEVVGERSGPLGWVLAVEAPAFRYAPGMSLAFDGEVPRQVGLFVDGVAAGAVSRWGGDPRALEFLRWTTAALPYRIIDPQRVAVLGSGGGLQVLAALSHGAARIDAVELNAGMVELANAVVDPVSAPYRHPSVRPIVGDARAHMERPGPDYDVVQLAALQPFGAAAGGVYAVSEDYLHTVEAFGSYLRRLAPGGMLAVTHWIRSPARDGLKLLASADRALQDLGLDRRGERVAYFRSWATGTLLVKPPGFEHGELARLRSFAESRLFDAAWYPGIDSSVVNRFNRLEEPVYYRAARALFGPEGDWIAFRRGYPFVVEPATDDRPYFSHFLELRTLPRLLDLTGRGWLPFAEWGYLVLLATLVQAAVISALLVLLPAGLAGPRRALAGGRWRWIVPYFTAIGLGYLFIEMALIQKFQLFLGHPVYAVLAVLTAFLIFSGLGSAILAPRVVRRPWLPAAIVGVLTPFYVAALPGLFSALAQASTAARGLVAAALLFPLAAAMGAPFPAALRVASEADETDSAIPWAWAVNGYASVVAVTLAALLAVHVGFRNVMGIATLLYLVAAVVLFDRSGARTAHGSEPPV